MSKKTIPGNLGHSFTAAKTTQCIIYDISSINNLEMYF